MGVQEEAAPPAPKVAVPAIKDAVLAGPGPVGARVARPALINLVLIVAGDVVAGPEALILLRGVLRRPVVAAVGTVGHARHRDAVEAPDRLEGVAVGRGLAVARPPADEAVGGADGPVAPSAPLARLKAAPVELMEPLGAPPNRAPLAPPPAPRPPDLVGPPLTERVAIAPVRPAQEATGAAAAFLLHSRARGVALHSVRELSSWALVGLKGLRRVAFATRGEAIVALAAAVMALVRALGAKAMLPRRLGARPAVAGAETARGPGRRVAP